MVKSFAGPGDEDGGDTKSHLAGVAVEEDGGGAVPCGVAAGFEGGADAAGREAGCIGLALDGCVAEEFGKYAAGTVGNDEGIVLLGGQAGEGWTSGCSELRRVRWPSLSSRRRRHRRGRGRAFRHGRLFSQTLEDILGEALLHDCAGRRHQSHRNFDAGIRLLHAISVVRVCVSAIVDTC